MTDNVDYRLLERFRTLQRLNLQPAPLLEPKRVAAAANRSRPPAIDLRD